MKREWILSVGQKAVRKTVENVATLALKMGDVLWKGENVRGTGVRAGWIMAVGNWLLI